MITGRSIPIRFLRITTISPVRLSTRGRDLRLTKGAIRIESLVRPRAG